MEGLREGRPLATLILMAVMHVLPSAAAEMAMESNFEGMDGAGRAFSRAQQEDRMLKKIILDLSIVVPLLIVGMFLLSRGTTKYDCEANGCCDAGAMHYAPDGGGS